MLPTTFCSAVSGPCLGSSSGSLSAPKSHLGIKRVPFLVQRDFEGNLNPQQKGIRAGS